MGYSSFCVCIVTNGANDDILVHSDCYHAYILASFGRHCRPIFLIYAYVQASIQTLSTYVGGAIATIWGS
jgi:hypothetical protein